MNDAVGHAAVIKSWSVPALLKIEYNLQEYVLMGLKLSKNIYCAIFF